MSKPKEYSKSGRSNIDQPLKKKKKLSRSDRRKGKPRLRDFM